MKERPILMTGWSVRAILDRRKNQTRRPVKPQPIPSGFGDGTWIVPTRRTWKSLHQINATAEDVVYWAMKWSPYQVGDRLWVRETWRVEQRKLRCDTDSFLIDYRADLGSPTLRLAPSEQAAKYARDELSWRPSIFMPRWASRITLEVVEVRVQQVQDISAHDAICEGIVPTAYLAADPCELADAARDDFQALWDSIYAKKGFGWDVNPWVWALTFQRVEQ